MHSIVLQHICRTTSVRPIYTYVQRNLKRAKFRTPTPTEIPDPPRVASKMNYTLNIREVTSRLCFCSGAISPYGRYLLYFTDSYTLTQRQNCFHRLIEFRVTCQSFLSKFNRRAVFMGSFQARIDTPSALCNWNCTLPFGITTVSDGNTEKINSSHSGLWRIGRG